MFLRVSDLNTSIDSIIIPQSIEYARQKGSTFQIAGDEMKAFFGISILWTFIDCQKLEITGQVM